jgi:hypothetical protein
VAVRLALTALAILVAVPCAAQRFADTSRAFVVLPNGQTQPAGLSSWNVSPEPIPPGSMQGNRT